MEKLNKSDAGIPVSVIISQLNGPRAILGPFSIERKGKI